MGFTQNLLPKFLLSHDLGPFLFLHAKGCRQVVLAMSYLLNVLLAFVSCKILIDALTCYHYLMPNY